jgi:Ca2+-binding RTX toxin-like protein
MELALLANVLLFIGTFALDFINGQSNGSANDTPDDTGDDNPRYDFAQNGTEGNDTVSAQNENTKFTLGAGDDMLFGSAGADLGLLGSGDDTASMGSGDDLAYGGAGDDSIWGALGDDTIFGDAGDDTLSGLSPLYGGLDTGAAPDGQDQLFGGAGSDHLILGRGDVGTGGAGNDIFDLDMRWNDGGDRILVQDFQRGADRLNIIYPRAFDAAGAAITPDLTIDLSANGQSSLIRLDGRIVATLAGAVNLTAGDITLVPSSVSDNNYVPANYAEERFGTAGADTLSASKGTGYFAEGGNDVFTGSGTSDYADMGAGNDSADMGAGNDSALGGAGADTLAGGAGSDTLLGGEGVDSLAGGLDDDRLYGGAGGDNLAGDGGNDTLDGGLGDDGIFGGFGNDQSFGGDGNDLIESGAGRDMLYGGAGDDSLRGYGVSGDNTSTDAQNDGADTLSGGAGNDAIWAGAGDVAFGGAGIDRFFVTEAQFGATGLTRIEDFAAGETIVISYTAADGAPVISLAPSPIAGEVNVLADGNVIARVVDTSGALTLGAISTVAITP